MAERRAALTIGVPVYNAATFLEQTLECLLEQTYGGFELIISDNASTDGTEEICRRYASRDRRIRYQRNETNIGATANFNRLFEQSSTELFKWAAGDDLLAPNHLEQCVAALAANPAAVLAYTRAKAIDAQGNAIKEYPAARKATSPKPQARFREFASIHHPFVPLFGVIRAEVLAKTHLIRPYPGGDRPLVSELSLLGPFHEVPEFLFFYRYHRGQSWQSWATHRELRAWYDPRRAAGRAHPHWQVLGGHLQAISGAQLTPWQRLACLACMVRWTGRHRRVLVADLLQRFENRHRGTT